MDPSITLELAPFEGAEDNQTLTLKDHPAPSNGAGCGVAQRTIDISALRGET